MSKPGNRIESNSDAAETRDGFTARVTFDGRGDSFSSADATQLTQDRPFAELVVRRTASDIEGTCNSMGFPKVTVECERGTASIRDVAEITWATENSTKTESLLSERPEVQVNLDLFCRRAVGGLIPVADLRDVCQSMRIAKAAYDSLNIGLPQEIPTTTQDSSL